MTLVPLCTKENAAAVDLPALEQGEQAYGQLLYTWRAILNRPGLFAAYLPFLRAVVGPGELDQQTKELTALQVCLLNHCRYSTSHRVNSARTQGVSEESLVALAAGDLSAFEEPLCVALELARAMTVDLPNRSISQDPSGIGDELREKVESLFSPTERVELLMNISMWNSITRFHRVMEFELDMPAPPAELDAVL